MLSLHMQGVDVYNGDMYAAGHKAASSVRVVFQAEDGIRDLTVTGVQTCALPICFEPRHGIRVRKGERVTDFVICFECDQVQIWTNDQRTGGFVIGSSPQPIFDEILKEIGRASCRERG